MAGPRAASARNAAATGCVSSCPSRSASKKMIPTARHGKLRGTSMPDRLTDTIRTLETHTMTNSPKPAGVHYALAISLLVSLICGVGWFQAHRHSAEMLEQRISDLEQRFIAIPVTDPDKSREIANRAYAEVLISRHRPRVIGDRQDIELPQDFEIYRQTQGRMM